MEKLDLTKEFKSYFSAKTNPEIVSLEPANYLSICGKGDPSSEDFQKNIEALYSTAYAVKFIYKSKNLDFVVSKLEGLWWFDEEKYPDKNIETSSTEVPREDWEYRLLIRMPDFVTKEETELAKQNAITKKGILLAQKIDFFTLFEGNCVQIMHVGPFSTEPDSLRKINDFMKGKNLLKNGLHHEIYLSDFRKTPPEKLKTILREPIKFA